MLGLGGIAKKVFGTANDRKVKSTQAVVDRINALEPEFEAQSDAEIVARTEALSARAVAGESLEDLLPEAFANCREAARRALGLRAFDVQLLGGIFLHQGMIAEMKTGEGKTLVATFPAYLNALAKKGVHVVTVNDYLARRDAEWMGKVYSALGLTTGVVVPQQPDDEKRAAYAADITYATNNELGFDYLRDNMRTSTADMAQRGHTLRHRGRGGFDPDRRGTHGRSSSLGRRKTAATSIPRSTGSSPKSPRSISARTRSSARSPSPTRATSSWRTACTWRGFCPRGSRSTIPRARPSCTTSTRACAPTSSSTRTSNTSSATTRSF